jgi:hypothetical protein
MQVFEQYCGARSPERETPNMARKRLRFVTDRVAHFTRNRGDGDVEKRKSKVGGQGQCSWPGEIHHQLVRHRRLIAFIGPFCCSSNFRNGTISSFIRPKLPGPASETEISQEVAKAIREKWFRRLRLSTTQCYILSPTGITRPHSGSSTRRQSI